MPNNLLPLTLTDDEKNDIKKAMYKAVHAVLRKKGYGQVAQDIVRDILDPNDAPEVDPGEVPGNQKVNVVNKSNSSKIQEKGVKKLKSFVDKKNNAVKSK